MRYLFAPAIPTILLIASLMIWSKTVFYGTIYGWIGLMIPSIVVFLIYGKVQRKRLGIVIDDHKPLTEERSKELIEQCFKGGDSNNEKNMVS